MIYKCIQFDLFELNNSGELSNAIEEVRMNFEVRAECTIHTESYKRSEDCMFVVVEVRGKEGHINQAIEESMHTFKKWAKETAYKTWNS